MTKPSVEFATKRGNYALFHSESPENPCHDVTEAWRLAATPSTRRGHPVRLTDEIAGSGRSNLACWRSENRICVVWHFRIPRESPILLHPQPIRPRNPHI